MQLTIDYVAKEARQFQDYFTRGVRVGEKWYNVEDADKGSVDALFTPELLSNGNTIEADILNDKVLIKIKLVKKAEPRQFQGKGNYNRKTPITKEEAFNTMEECVTEAKRIADKHIEAPSSEDVRTLANTLFIRIMDK